MEMEEEAVEQSGLMLWLALQLFVFLILSLFLSLLLILTLLMLLLFFSSSLLDVMRHFLVL